MNAYDQLRRAATFIRWHEEDADKFVPSLYAGRGGRGAAVKPVPTPAPVPAPVEAAPAAAPKAATAPNMPGGSPFAS